MQNLKEKISKNLKSLRSSRGWTLDLASEKTGVSKAMLGQIERGESSPTISVLWKIASGFETSFSAFIEDTIENISTPIHRVGNLHQMHEEDNKIRVLPIFPYDEKLLFETFIIELLPGCKHLSPPHKGGLIEHVIVTEGEMEVLANGLWHKLRKNEGLYFNADQPHGYQNITSEKATICDIIHYPKPKF